MTYKDRFYSGVERIPFTDCWIWNKSVDNHGYGYIKVNNKTTKAHRISYTIHNGEIPSGLYVLHTCDNPSCVNPKHLYAGTPQDNMNDKMNRGRANWSYESKSVGSDNPRAKITEEEVLIYRKNYKRGMAKDIASKHNMCVEAVRRMIRGDSWKHI